jgi:succinyl-CoA synthetase alpha subunit
MAILIDEKKRVLVQGITGREGRARTRLMREYGTNVVGGVTPGKGGQTVLGVPVFNTPQEAVNSLGNIDISVLFVPAVGVKDAAISAIDAGIKLSVLVPDRVPVWDAMEIAAAAKANGARESESSAAPAAWLQALGIIWDKLVCGFQPSCTSVAMRCSGFEFLMPR